MMDNAKVKSIEEWEPPKKVIELRSFLEFVNYYQRFIQGYSAIVTPWTELLTNRKTWESTTKYKEAFQGFKDAITQETNIDTIRLH